MTIEVKQGPSQSIFVFTFNSRGEWERLKLDIWKRAETASLEDQEYVSNFLERIDTRLTDKYARWPGAVSSRLFLNEVCVALKYMMFVLASV